MPKDTKSDGKDTRSVFDRFKLPSPGRSSRSSASRSRDDASGSRSPEQPSSSASDSAGPGRGGGPPARARGAAAVWQARRETYASIAQENEETLVPQLLKQSPSLAAAVNRSIEYSSWPPKTADVAPLDGGRKTRFSFQNADSLDAAEALVTKYGSDKVAVLNMANAYVAGGGYLSGAAAQEEALCRRSTLYAHINRPDFYPLDDEGGIWSESVRVFRAGDDGLYEVLPVDKQFDVNVISVAAIELPKLTQDGQSYADAEEMQSMVRKMMAILRIAKLQGQDALVLGAFGCGAFRNPPAHVAKMFLGFLTRHNEIVNAFAEVTFAILDLSGTGTSNLSTFTAVWKDVLDAQQADDDKEKEEEGRAADSASSADQKDAPKEVGSEEASKSVEEGSGAAVEEPDVDKNATENA